MITTEAAIADAPKTGGGGAPDMGGRGGMGGMDF
jgi:chaperonin GroEL